MFGRASASSLHLIQDRTPKSNVGAVEIEFEAKVWLYDGPDPWHFVTLPDEAAEALQEEVAPAPGGFGSVPVVVTIGSSTWSTSLFPDRKLGTLLLPVKAAIRRAEQLVAGDLVTVKVSNR